MAATKQTGFTLFELMLVLATCAVLLMSTWQVGQNVRHQREKSQALAAVQAVMMTAALHANDHLSVSELIDEHFLRASKIKNPLLTEFTLQYLDNPNRIVCNANFKKSVKLTEQSALAKALHAEFNNDTHQLEWHTTPDAALQPISSFWMMQAHLQHYVKQVTVHAS